MIFFACEKSGQGLWLAPLLRCQDFGLWHRYFSRSPPNGT